MSKIRPIAIYLPQFHPIPENDIWWGKGFTEWKNVVKSKPRFEGHYQPHLPSDLGYYDLRLPEIRQAQADLAKHFGIYGFCYYHYWFNGRQVLERPFKEVFEFGKPDFPFMLCWANENWTRIWDGGSDEILLEQKYSHEDDVAHINHLIRYFKDERYIKVNGRPVFVIYKDALIPDLNKTINTFREECAKQNIDIYLCKFERENGTLALNDKGSKFDAAIEFQPLSISLKEYKKHLAGIQKMSNRISPKYLDLRRYLKYVRKLLRGKPDHSNIKPLFKNDIISYSDFIDFDLNYTRDDLSMKLYPCVSPGFDNSSRRQGTEFWATIFHGSTPAIFRKWVEGEIKKFTPFSEEENLFFINAWNEWAEGNHLEPDEHWGMQYLEAFSRGLKSE